MPYCSKCGKDNPPESKYCNACGATLYNGEAVPAPAVKPAPSYTAPSKPKSFWKKKWREHTPAEKRAVVAICIVAAIASFAGGFTFAYSMDAGTGWYGSSATVHITVQSTHVANTVDVIVVVDGTVIDSRSLGPMDKFTVDYKPLMLFHDSENVQIWARAEGGGFGEMQDIETVTIEKGDVLNVHLMI
jgi:type V secretory pathway adhesin AidA